MAQCRRFTVVLPPAQIGITCNTELLDGLFLLQNSPLPPKIMPSDSMNRSNHFSNWFGKSNSVSNGLKVGRLASN